MRKSVWFLMILAAAAAIYTGVWYATAVFVRAQTLQWLEARRQQSLTMTHAAPKLTGFPFTAAVAFKDFSVAAPSGTGQPGWTWHAPAVRVFARPFVFNSFSLDVGGMHRLSGLEAQDTALNLEQAVAAFTIGVGGIDHVAVRIAQAVSAHGTVDKIDADIAVTNMGLHLELNATRAAFPDVFPPPLGPTLETVRASVDITGPIATGAPLPAILEAWRAGGGTVEVRDFAFDWPPVSGAGSGTLALDRALQPEGAFSGTFQGFLNVVDMLVAAGRTEPREASLARGALIFMATTPYPGAPPELKVSVTVQDRKVYAGPLTLMALPPVIWREDVVLP